MKTFLKTFVWMTLLAVAVFSAEGDAPRYDVGASLGMVGGSGVSVRRWFGEKDAIQLNFTPFYTEKKYPKDADDGYYTSLARRDSGYANTGYINLGALYLHQLGKFKIFRISSFGGGSYSLLVDKADYYQTSYYSGEVQHRVRDRIESTVALGGGLGGGIEFWRLNLTVNLGIRGALDLEDNTKDLTPSLDAAVHFRL